MRRVFLVVVITICLLTPYAARADSTQLDGLWWHGLSYDRRLLAIHAMIEAYTDGYIMAWVGDHPSNIPKTGPVPSPTPLRYAPKDWPAFSKPWSVYVAQIDSFYATYPNANDVEVEQLLGCLQDNAIVTCDKLGTLAPTPR